MDFDEQFINLPNFYIQSSQQKSLPPPKLFEFWGREGFLSGAGGIRTLVQIGKHRTVYMLSHLLGFRSSTAG
jgi:hypothetical protein